MLNQYFGFSTKLLRNKIHCKIYFNFNVLSSNNYIELIKQFKEKQQSKSNEQCQELIKEIQFEIQNSHNQAEDYLNYGKFEDAETLLDSVKRPLQDLLQQIQLGQNTLYEDLYIASAKTSLLLGDCQLRQSNFDLADSSLIYSLKVLQKMNKKMQKVQINLLDTLILLYQQNLYSIFDDKQLKEIEDQINDLMQNSQNNEELTQKYQIFKLKYLLEDQEQVDKLFNQLTNQSQQSTDLTNFLMKQAMNKGNPKSALLYCEKLLNSLIHTQDPNHHLFEASITNFFALSRENQEQQQYEEIIQNIKSKFFGKGFEALERLIQFENILNQGLKIINSYPSINEIQNLINKLEIIKFTSGSKYHRYAIFMLLGLKRELKEIQSQIG